VRQQAAGGRQQEFKQALLLPTACCLLPLFLGKYQYSFAIPCRSLYGKSNIMTLISSQALLNYLEQTTERHIQKAIEDYQNMDAARLLKPARNGGWSIAQCLDHLNGYGRYYYPLIQQKLNEHTKAGETFTGSWLGNYFVKMMDPETGKRKMKAFKNHLPASNLDAHEVVSEFIRQQEHLLRLIRTSRKRDLNRIKIPISLTKFIKLNLGDTLRFIVAHNERHMRQAERGENVINVINVGV
jgi:DinB superfamily